MFSAALLVTGVVADMVPGVVAVEDRWGGEAVGVFVAVVVTIEGERCMGAGMALFQAATEREGEEVFGEWVRVTRLEEKCV